jgi:hypothetical protein
MSPLEVHYILQRVSKGEPVVFPGFWALEEIKRQFGEGPVTDVKRNDFGYRFGYRHQFGQITLNYAKWLFNKDLGSSQLTLNFPYLS